nr:MAG TPA: hypothetical protein [Caudoviricetes sp.]
MSMCTAYRATFRPYACQNSAFFPKFSVSLFNV